MKFLTYLIIILGGVFLTFTLDSAISGDDGSIIFKRAFMGILFLLIGYFMHRRWIKKSQK